MRVGIDCSVLHGRFSGVEKAVRGLIGGLAETQGKQELVLLCGRKPPLDLPLPSGMVWHCSDFDPANRLRRIAFQQWELPRLAERLGLDVLHGPAYITPVHARFPTLVSVYDLMVFLYPDLCARANRVHYRLVMPRCVPRCERVLVPSAIVGSSVVETLKVDPARVRVSHLGLDPIFARSPDAEEVASLRDRLNLSERFLLFVGNLEPKKGLDVLVRALGRLREGPPLVIAGKRAWGVGGLDKLIASEGIQDRVTFTGYVPDEDLPALYAAARWFVFPSIYEGFGLPPLEAMASGTPVITSDGGALPETTGDACVRVEAGSVEELAEAISASWGDDALRESLSRAGVVQASRFSWRNHALDARQLYAEVRHGP